MRIVAVNYVHPEVNHISSVRIPSFARELGLLGHHVLLITPTLEAQDAPYNPSSLSFAMNQHDWSRPFHLPIAPVNCLLTKKIRSPKTPAFLRKIMVFFSFLRKDGVYFDWSEATVPFWQPILANFNPDIVWGTFLTSDTWRVVKAIGLQGSKPWILDIKDGWEYFIPHPIQNLLARRFRDAAGLTANSKFVAELSRKWFLNDPKVIYSGIQIRPLSNVHIRDDQNIAVNIVGSIYSTEKLVELFNGIRNWWISLHPKTQCRVRVVYMGADWKAVANIVRLGQYPFLTEILGYLSIDEYLPRLQNAVANAYIWSPRTFHHKVLELLVCGRPILAFPGESSETKEMVKFCEGRIFICKDQNSILMGLRESMQAWQRNERYGNTQFLATFSWSAQAKELESYLMEKSLKGSHKANKSLNSAN